MKYQQGASGQAGEMTLVIEADCLVLKSPSVFKDRGQESAFSGVARTWDAVRKKLFGQSQGIICHGPQCVNFRHDASWIVLNT